MATIKINNTTLSFNTIYYIATDGNDINTGTEASPFLTLSKANSVVQDGDAIFVKGSHIISSDIMFSRNISVIGNFLEFGSELKPNSFRRFKTTVNVTQKFYNLVLHQTSGVAEMFDGYQGTHSYKGHIELYNCVVRLDGNDLDRAENIYLQSFKVENCARLVGNTATLSGYTANAQYVNVANEGEFVISITNSSKTTCLDNVVFDNKYNITSGGWENTGTGTDPNGSQANIGVYGGQFNWNKFIIYHLLKSGGKYYTYQDGAFIETTATQENFENLGIDLSILTTPTDKVNKPFVFERAEGDGKVYKVSVDPSKYKGIKSLKII